jgi:hypothetical protein
MGEALTTHKRLDITYLRCISPGNELPGYFRSSLRDLIAEHLGTVFLIPYVVAGSDALAF